MGLAKAAPCCIACFSENASGEKTRRTRTACTTMIAYAYSSLFCAKDTRFQCQMISRLLLHSRYWNCGWDTGVVNRMMVVRGECRMSIGRNVGRLECRQDADTRPRSSQRTALLTPCDCICLHIGGPCCLGRRSCRSSITWHAGHQDQQQRQWRVSQNRAKHKTR